MSAPSAPPGTPASVPCRDVSASRRHVLSAFQTISRQVRSRVVEANEIALADQYCSIFDLPLLAIFLISISSFAIFDVGFMVADCYWLDHHYGGRIML